MKREENFRSLCAAILVAVGVIALVVMFVRCGFNPNLWFDESGQFWMSKGQIHFAPPLTPDGTLADVLQANRTANSDPGGYTVALHWWLSGGTSPLWLRSFSFIFFVATAFAFAGIAWLWTRNRLLAAAAGVLPACSPLLVTFAFELRAYSMEACGIALSVLLLEYAGRRPAVGRFLALGILAAFFLTSRYSFICPATATGLALFWMVRDFPWRQRLSFLAAYAIPVLASCAAIYLVTLGHSQSHQKPNPPYYVEQYVLGGKTLGEMAGIAVRALFSWYELGALLFVALFLFFALRRNERSGYQRFTPLFIIVVVVNLEVVLLSLLGKYPWCPNLRWGIGLNLLSMLSLLPALWMLARSAAGEEATGRKGFSLGVCLAVSLLALYGAATSRVSSEEPLYDNIMKLGPASLYGKTVFITQMAQPSVRYLYEYGPLKRYAEGIYPQSFIFEVPPKVTDYRPIDYFISPEGIRRGESSGGRQP
ncbi:MAG TPA: hypothetical protein VJ550_11485 [Geomonas sp.]|nr:hypothetical protein [Geomonas sp.]